MEVEAAHDDHGQGGDLGRRSAEAGGMSGVAQMRIGRRRDSFDGDGAAASTGGGFETGGGG